MDDLHKNIVENLETIAARIGLPDKFDFFKSQDDPNDIVVKAFYAQHVNHLFAVLAQDSDFLPADTLSYDKNNPAEFLIRAQGNPAQLAAGIYDILENTTNVTSPQPPVAFPTPSKRKNSDQLKERIWEDVSRIAQEKFSTGTTKEWYEDEIGEDGKPTGTKFYRSPNPMFITQHSESGKAVGLMLHGHPTHIKPMAQFLNANDIPTHYSPPTLGSEEALLSIDLRKESLHATYSKVRNMTEKLFNLKPQPGVVDPHGTTSPGMPASVRPEKLR